MLCIQAPGSVVIVVYLIFVSEENITTWAAYFVSSVEQFILLSLILYYNHLGKNKSEKGETETTRLLESGSSEDDGGIVHLNENEGEYLVTVLIEIVIKQQNKHLREQLHKQRLMLKTKESELNTKEMEVEKLRKQLVCLEEE
jgi:hypothetical protein